MRRDVGVWTVPKGGVEPGEDPFEAAQREFIEETSFRPQTERFEHLGEVKQKSGKRVLAWAFEGDCDPSRLVSNTFVLPWPPRSGRTKEFPEIDRAAFFTLEEARVKIMDAQRPFLERALAWMSAFSP